MRSYGIIPISTNFPQSTVVRLGFRILAVFGTFHPKLAAIWLESILFVYQLFLNRTFLLCCAVIVELHRPVSAEICLIWFSFTLLSLHTSFHFFVSHSWRTAILTSAAHCERGQGVECMKLEPVRFALENVLSLNQLATVFCVPSSDVLFGWLSGCSLKGYWNAAFGTEIRHSITFTGTLHQSYVTPPPFPYPTPH